MQLHALDSSQNSTLSLTQEEQAWLHKHQKVLFSADHIKILEERLGLQHEKIVPKS